MTSNRSNRLTTICRLRRFVDDFSESISGIDLLATSVLASHFLIENELDKILGLLAKTPEQLGVDNARFVQKVKWIRAFGPIGDHKRWELVLTFNLLRNKVAHKPDGPARKEALQKLRKALTTALFFADSTVLDEREWRDYNVILAAGMECTLFLTHVRGKVGT